MIEFKRRKRKEDLRKFVLRPNNENNPTIIYTDQQLERFLRKLWVFLRQPENWDELPEAEVEFFFSFFNRK